MIEKVVKFNENKGDKIKISVELELPSVENLQSIAKEADLVRNS